MSMPKLRFPEFKNTAEWDFPNGDHLFVPIVNKDHNSDLPILAVSQEFGAIPRDMIDYQLSVTDKSVESYKVVEVGDFIISLRSFQGGIEYSEYKGICSPAYIILRKTHDKIHNHFYRLYFKTDRFIAELNKNLEGIRDGKMVSYSQFSDLKLPNPKPKEQQKIADCLSSLDDLIAAHNQKLVALKTHKKGLMQQLFPAEGETVPRLRFPEFRDKGDWEEKELYNFLSESPDYGLNAASVQFSENLPAYLRITDIAEDGSYLKEGKVSVSCVVSENDYLKAGQIVLARTGASVGKSYRYNSKDGKLVFAGYLIRLKPSNKISSIFLSQYINTNRYWKWVGIISTRSGQPGINSWTSPDLLDRFILPFFVVQTQVG